MSVDGSFEKVRDSNAKKTAVPIPVFSTKETQRDNKDSAPLHVFER